VTGNQIKYFEINTAYIVPGNVDLQTGNIVFAGDVIVYGDVMDNLIIKSLGNIYVGGSVFNSTLTASGSIAVKGNVLGSNLYSGNFGMDQESQVQININQGQNSTLKSNGDILIRKEGVIHCDLYSAGNIVFSLDNSVCRGSRLEAGDTISAMYVGGITGVRTSLKAAKKIIVKKMFEGRVIVGRQSMDIFESVEDMTFDHNSFE
jgi:uncharacterized protein (DUF342 family)